MTSNLTTWNSDEKSDSESKKEEPKEKKLPIPVFVDIEVVLWDNVQQREFKYVFTLEIITDTEFVQKKHQWSFTSFFEKHQEKPDDKKSPQPGATENTNTWSFTIWHAAIINARITTDIQCAIPTKFRVTKTIRRAF